MVGQFDQSKLCSYVMVGQVAWPIFIFLLLRVLERGLGTSCLLLPFLLYPMIDDGKLSWGPIASFCAEPTSDLGG